MASETDKASVLSSWAIGPVQSTARLGSGSNNHNWLIEASSGAYVLRVYRNIDAEAHIAFEHALLQALAAADLPFAVPVPLETRSRATITQTDGGVASLARRIAGRHPHLGDPADTRAAGAGLGVLDEVLAAIQVGRPSPSASGYGDLQAVHPSVTGAGEMVTHLGLTGAERAGYERSVDATEAAWPTLVATLPKQLIHSDYVGVNILLADGGVSGVLDFEFSAPDLRALDLATSIWSFCLRSYIGRDEAGIAALVRAFLAGYSERLTATKEEWTALPVLLLRRQVVVCLHWLGRSKAGLSSEREARDRLAGLAGLQRWLEGEGSAVLAELAPSSSAASSPPGGA